MPHIGMPGSDVDGEARCVKIFHNGLLHVDVYAIKKRHRRLNSILFTYHFYDDFLVFQRVKAYESSAATSAVECANNFEPLLKQIWYPIELLLVNERYELFSAVK
jgi:hypothetical protein